MGLCHRPHTGWAMARYTHSPSLNRMPWRSISRRLSRKDIFALQHPLKFLLRGQEGRRLEALHSLPGTQQNNHKILLSTSPCLYCLGTATQRNHLYQAGPSGAYNLIGIREGDEWKTAFVNTYRTLWILRDAVWPGQCPLRIPGFHAQGAPGVPPPVCTSLPWHLGVFPDHGQTSAACLGGPSTLAWVPPIPQSWEMSLPSVLCQVPWLWHQ